MTIYDYSVNLTKRKRIDSINRNKRNKYQNSQDSLNQDTENSQNSTEQNQNQNQNSTEQNQNSTEQNQNSTEQNQNSTEQNQNSTEQNQNSTPKRTRIRISQNAQNVLSRLSLLYSNNWNRIIADENYINLVETENITEERAKNFIKNKFKYAKEINKKILTDELKEIEKDYTYFNDILNKNIPQLEESRNNIMNAFNLISTKRKNFINKPGLYNLNNLSQAESSIIISRIDNTKTNVNNPEDINRLETSTSLNSSLTLNNSDETSENTHPRTLSINNSIISSTPDSNSVNPRETPSSNNTTASDLKKSRNTSKIQNLMEEYNFLVDKYCLLLKENEEIKIELRESLVQIENMKKNDGHFKIISEDIKLIKNKLLSEENK